MEEQELQELAAAKLAKDAAAARAAEVASAEAAESEAKAAEVNAAEETEANVASEVILEPTVREETSMAVLLSAGSDDAETFQTMPSTFEASLPSMFPTKEADAKDMPSAESPPVTSQILGVLLPDDDSDFGVEPTALPIAKGDTSLSALPLLQAVLISTSAGEPDVAYSDAKAVGSVVGMQTTEDGPSPQDAGETPEDLSSIGDVGDGTRQEACFANLH